MIKIRKLNDEGTLFRVSQYTENSDGVETFVWAQRMDRKEFITWLKEAIKEGKIRRSEWFNHGRMYLKYSRVPVCFTDDGRSASGLLHGANA